MTFRRARSIPYLLFAIAATVICCAWILNEIQKGQRDVAHLNSIANSPMVANTFFDTGFVIVPDWLGERGGFITEPFRRVVEIDFRLDTLDEANDILPFAVFEDARLLRIDSFPKTNEGILAFRKFKSLKQIYVAWPQGNEIDVASKLIPGVEIKQAQ